MRTNTWLSLAAVSLALLGCAYFQPDGGPGGPGPRKHVDKECKRNNCTIQVTVTACASTGISLQYPTVGVVSGETNVPIEWSINSNQYEFADNGIVIKNDPNRVFINGGASPNKKMFTWTDRNPAGDKTDYKYTVTVKPKNSTTPCPSYDPIIVNDY